LASASSRDSQVNPVAVAAMREVGIDITAEQPKVWTTEAVQASDVVITIGCAGTGQHARPTNCQPASASAC
jgi:arsenate reductase